MKTIELTYPHSLHTETLPETSAAIGFFDGIHKGHQEVIKTAVDHAKKTNRESAVITFHPHPSVVLNQSKKKVKYITPINEKEAILKQLKVDRLYIITFNKELSTLTPETFINHFIIGLNIKHLVAGFDYTFGHKGKGNMSNIHMYTKQEFTYEIIDKVILNGEKISSTLIRDLLKEGKVAEVQPLLGRYFTVKGTVIKGYQRGRMIGFPTANINVDDEALLPKNGIYIVKVNVNNETYMGMASLGTNPTFTDENIQRLEVNILDFNQNIYGKKLDVEWHGFIRDEEKYDDVEDLIKQIKDDEKTVRTYFQNTGK